MFKSQDGRTPSPVPTEEYDVQDKTALIEFCSKRNEWLNWLVGRDQHSIRNQIVEMNWTYIIFRIINESRVLAIHGEQFSSSLNPLVAHFIDNAYVRTQGITIRRLLEKANTCPKKQVISLRRLVDDLCKNRSLFTRELYVGFDGTPFDPAPIQAGWEEDRLEKIRRHWEGRARGESSSEAIYDLDPPSSGPKAWKKSNDRHLIFDRLAATPDGQRTRNDLVEVKGV